MRDNYYLSSDLKSDPLVLSSMYRGVDQLRTYPGFLCITLLSFSPYIVFWTNAGHDHCLLYKEETSSQAPPEMTQQIASNGRQGLLWTLAMDPADKMEPDNKATDLL